jgi:hypothetical protein
LPKKKWEPGSIKIKQSKVGQMRFEQLLAEVGEVLYKRLCQHVQSDTQSVSTEPAKLGKTQFKKAVSI